MSEHLSDLFLDEVAAGSRKPPMPAHLQTCDECRRRLDQLAHLNAQARARPRFEQVWSRLDLPASPPKPQPTRWPVLMFSSAFAMAAVFLVVRPEPDRVKGAFALSIVSETGESSANSFHPGERVSLKVNTQGHPYALVLGIDGSDAVEKVWPPKSDQSGAVPNGSSVRLAPAFVVTPGSLTLHAIFSDEPIAFTTARTQLQKALAAARGSGKDPATIALPSLPLEQGRAHAVLQVAFP